VDGRINFLTAVTVSVALFVSCDVNQAVASSVLLLPQLEEATGLNRLAGKVQVAFYTESLCPDCRRFTNLTLAPIFENGVSNLMDMEYLPYGNARLETSSGKITCQHGELECELNKVFGCAVHLNPDQSTWFPFILCMEREPPLIMKAALGKCTAMVSPPLDVDAINNCAYGELGQELQLQYAAKTDALQPPHTEVPWITVNGVALLGDVDKLQQYICAAWQGHRPAACFGKLS